MARNAPSVEEGVTCVEAILLVSAVVCDDAGGRLRLASRRERLMKKSGAYNHVNLKGRGAQGPRRSSFHICN